jgi:hypothetical protein
MKMLNALEGFKPDGRTPAPVAKEEGLSILLRVLYPITPHLTHLWQRAGLRRRARRPAGRALARNPTRPRWSRTRSSYVLQVNGKLRGAMRVPKPRPTRPRCRASLALASEAVPEIRRRPATVKEGGGGARPPGQLVVLRPCACAPFSHPAARRPAAAAAGRLRLRSCAGATSSPFELYTRRGRRLGPGARAASARCKAGAHAAGGRGPKRSAGARSEFIFETCLPSATSAPWSPDNARPGARTAAAYRVGFRLRTTARAASSCR